MYTWFTNSIWMFVWNFNGKVKEELLSVCPWYLQSQLGASCRSSRLDDWVCAGFGTSACEVPGDWRLWAGAQQRLIYLPGSLPGITGSFRAGPHLICFWTPGNWHGSWHVIGAQKMIAGRLIEWGSYHHHHWARQWSATPRWGLRMGANWLNEAVTTTTAIEQGSEQPHQDEA